MDTKEKNRSGSKSRSSTGRSGSASRTRRPASASAGSKTAASRSAGQSRNTSASSRSSAASGQRPRTAPQNSQNAQRTRIAPQNAQRQVKSSAPEQVFKTETKRDPQAAKRAAQRRRSAKRAREREAQLKKQAARPAVEYTPAKPLNVNRLLLQAVVALAVVLAIVIGLSVFFKVESVVVYGNSAYSAWTVQEAAGIEGGEHLLTMNRTRVSGKIIASLPYVESARIGIKLPDTVNIYIEEVDVAYAVKAQDGGWWLIASTGNVLEQIDAGTASKYTKILGVELNNPVVGNMAHAVDNATVVEEETEAPTEAPAEAPTDANGNTEPVQTEPPREVKVVTGQDRLDAALVILSSLELNQIIGDAASVDVTTIDDLQLWYGQRYQVHLGDAQNMDYKISCMKSAIAQQKDYEMGILDVSFTRWPDQVAFTPAGAES